MSTLERGLAPPEAGEEAAGTGTAPPGEEPSPRPARRRSRLVRRILYAGAALLLVALVVWAMRPAPLEVETATIEAGPLRVTIDEEGTTRLVDRYRVAAPVAGRLLRIGLREGDAGGAGEVVARIVPAALDPRTAEAARARVAAAEASLRQASTRAEQAREAAEQAERELPRRRELAAAGAISREALEQQELSSASRRHELESARAAQQAAAADLRAARAALLDAAPSSTASVVEVRSPVAGRVLRVPEASERAVAPGEPLVDVGESDALEVAVDVLTTDAVRIRPGTPLRIEDWGGEGTLRGQVRSVEPEAFTKVSALGVEEQRVNVIGELTEVPASVGVGYRVEARFVVWERPEVVRVPVGALFGSGEGWGAFVVEDGRSRLREVEVGARGEEAAQVLDGLRPGEEVVLYPSDRIEEGMRVRRRAPDRSSR